MIDLVNVLGNLEYGMSLQFLVDLGDWFGTKCDTVSGEWIRLADNSYQCVNTDLDRWIEGIIRDVSK